MNTCGECYWYSDITVKKCDRENDPTTEDNKACSLFEPKEETCISKTASGANTS